MRLKRLITENQLSGTPEEIAEALNAKTIKILKFDRITSAGMLDRLGLEDGGVILEVFRTLAQTNPVFESQYQRFNTVGLDFTHPLVIQTVEQLVASNVLSRQLADKLLDLPYERISLYEQEFGVGSVATPDDVIQAFEQNTEPTFSITVTAIHNGDNEIITVLVNQVYQDGSIANRLKEVVWKPGQPFADDLEGLLVAKIKQAIDDYLRGRSNG